MQPSDANAPSLAVFIPVYNGEAHLQEALDSLYRQTFTDFTIVVFNDGSTDGTRAVLECQTDPRLRVVHQPNLGVTRTRQRALEQIPQELIAILDADDIAHPDRLAVQYRFLCEYPDIVLLGSAIQLIDDQGRKTGIRRYPETDTEIRRLLPIENPFAQPAVMFRREAALRAGGYLHQLEDYDLWLRMGKTGKMHNLQTPLTFYRLHPTQMKSIRTRNLLRQTLAVRWKAIRSYGYAPTLRFWLTFAAQAFLYLLPAKAIHSLFLLKLRWQPPSS